MNEFWISPVANRSLTKQTFWFTRRKPREKAPQPGGKFGRSKRTRHTQDFGQRWRKKILPVRLPCWAVGVVPEPRTALSPQHLGEWFVVTNASIFQPQGQCEGAIV